MLTSAELENIMHVRRTVDFFIIALRGDHGFTAIMDRQNDYSVK